MSLPPTDTGSLSSWNAVRAYFVPPVVIPIAIMLTVLLFVLIHGPAA